MQHNDSTFATQTPIRSKPGSLEVTILFTAFIAATYGFGIYLFSALIPDMRKELGFDYSMVGYATGGVQAGFLSFAFLSGVLAPKLGMKRTVLLSVFLTAVCLVLMPLIHTAAQLAVLLALMGGAAASVWVPMVAVAKRMVSPAHLGKALGLMSSGTAYGIFLNGLILPAVLPAYGWRSVWLVVGLLSLGVAAWAAYRMGLDDASDRSAQPAASTSSSADWTVFKSPRTIAIWAMTFLNGLSCMPVQNYVAAMLREQLGYSVGQVAQLVGVNGAVGMVSGVLIGALADRITIKWAMVVTYAILSLAAACFWWHAGTTMLLVGTVAFGVAFYAIFGLVPAYVGVLFSSTQATTIFGIGNVLLGVGGLIGNFVGGMSKQVTGDFDTLFGWVLGASLLTLLLSLLMGNERRAARPTP